MNTVFKYPIPIMDRFDVGMPRFACFCLAMVQDRQPCMWWEVDTESELVIRHFSIVGTGRPLPEDPEGRMYAYHCGSFPMPPFIWHLYEIADSVLGSWE